MSANDLPFDPRTVSLGTILMDGKPAIHVAAKKGNIKAMEVLLGRGKRIGLLSLDNQNVLHVAAIHGLEDVCKFALKYVKEHSTSRFMHLNCDQCFACHINATDFDMSYPLSLAIKHGHVSAAGILLEFGSSPVLKSRNQNVPTIDCYEIAIDHNQLAALRFFLLRARPSFQDLDSLLMTIISRKRLRRCLRFCGFGANPRRQFTLQAAAEVGSAEMMRILVNHGVNINTVEIDGQDISCIALCLFE